MEGKEEEMDRSEDIMDVEIEKEQNDEVMEENNNQDEEMQDTDLRSESSVSNSDEEEGLRSGNDDELDLEVSNLWISLCSFLLLL